MATQIPVEAGPYGVCMTSNGQYVWVAIRGSSNTIQKITTSDLSVSAPIAVGSLPSSVIMTTNQDYVCVVNSGGDTVSTVDTSTNTVITSAIIGSQLNQIVANSVDINTLWVVSTIPSNVVGIFNLFKLTNTGGNITVANSYSINNALSPDNLYGITISSDGNYLYLSNYGQNPGVAGTSVYRYIISSGTPFLLATYTVGPNPTYMAISSDGVNLYVLSDSVYRINTVTSVVTPISLINSATITGGITISSDDQYVWVVVYISPIGFNVQQINTTDLSVTQADTTVFNDPVGICVNPTTTPPNYIWVANGGGNEVVRFAVPFSGPTPPPPPCFPAGVRIQTAEGSKQVEDLTEEDRVVTSDGRDVAIKIFSFSIPFATKDTAPYRLSAGCLGYGCPVQDICLSGRHAIQDGRGVWQIPSQLAKHNPGVQQYGIGESVTYYHIECPNFYTDHLVAEGSVVESFRNRQGSQGVTYVWDKALSGFTRPVKEFPIPKNPKTLLLF
jgi:DNA-binding beta-propeller fold protein YncE